jgi:hypothetical protein
LFAYKDDNVPTLFFTCPNTKRKVSTGADAPTLCAGIERAKKDSQFLRCPECGESHEGATLVVYMEDEAVETSHRAE